MPRNRTNERKTHRRFRSVLAPSVIALGALASTNSAGAKVVRFEIESREPYANGHEFGEAGSFERISATAYYEVDPANPHNTVIVDLDKAPRNASGKVEFTAPVIIIKPLDPARGNGKIFYNVNNRGNTDLGAVADPAKVGGQVAQQLRMGFSLVDAGWHGDGKPNPVQLYPAFPVAQNADGSSITGPLRLEFSVAQPAFSQPLAQFWMPYRAADTNTSSASLVMRERAGGEPITVPGDAWAFGTCPTGRDSFSATDTDICLFDGFSPDRLYELVYQARDPIVMGLAYAVTRDLGAFLRYEAADTAGNPNPLAAPDTFSPASRAYVYGASSTGMYLREFLYLGFNETEDGRKLFDGAFINTGGANRLFANVRFAHPTFYSAQDNHQDYVSNAIGPATYGVTFDPLTGNTDGILKRPETDPVVIEAVDENSFWTWKNSLQVADGQGNPVAIPDNVRLYFKGSSSHLGIYGLLSPPVTPNGFAGECRYPAQALNAPGFNPQAVERSLPGLGGALAVVLDDWADRQIEPPENNFPTLGNGSLVTLAEYRKLFPDIPGLAPPERMAELEVLDFGPGFNSTGGRISHMPPRHGAAYKLFVPRPDADGMAFGSHRPVEVAAPLGTNVGWNIRRKGYRAGDLCGLEGAYIPFARTKAERLASGDPRLSLEERYGDHEGFVAQVKRATDDLVRSRFMLPADAEAWQEEARSSDILKK